ncbi:MAG: DUF1573 domain-containing protein [Lishizhenia sp.]
MKKVILSVAVFAVMLSCGDQTSIDTTLNTTEGEVVSKLATQEMSDEELKQQAAEIQKIKEEKERIARETQTTIAFNKEIHDFGTVLPETEASYTFTVINTGDKPLVIEDAKASCGCTVPKKPEAPIAPGEEGELEVTFKSKPGQTGVISKTVTITANIPNKTTTLQIKATVED